MQRLIITGGKRLAGQVRVSGSKNAVLPILAATLLTEEECILHNVPRLRDVAFKAAILRQLGARVLAEEAGDGRILRVRVGRLASWEITEQLMRRMRSSIVFMGALLGRAGHVRLSYPGGCAIGPRPINFHLKSLTELGVKIVEQGGYIEARASRLMGTSIHLDQPSVGATENIMLAAVLAQGTTTITNAAREPEIGNLQGFLNAMGARISGAGTDTLRIEGVDRLRGAEYRVIPDRIEAGTFMAAAAITGGDLFLENVEPAHLEAPIAKLREIGCQIEVTGGGLRVRGPQRPRAADIKTMPYPGFPTDLQSQFMSLLALADGTSIITESIFENRFKVAGELQRMGAQITIDGRLAVVRGVERFSGAMVEAMDDLRGGAALVLAGLAAEGTTTLEGVQHIERGYQDLDGKLRSLGARVHLLRRDAGAAGPHRAQASRLA